MLHVFVSSSSKDRHIAEAACAELEKEGLKCWIAPRDILPGMEWGESIVKAIRNSQVIVLIFSANSNRSSQVKREVERAVHREVPIIVFRVEDVEPDGSLEYYLSTHHWLDAIKPPLEANLRILAADLKTFLDERAKNIPVTTQSFKLETEKEAEAPGIKEIAEPEKEAGILQVTEKPEAETEKETGVSGIEQSAETETKKEADISQAEQSAKSEPEKEIGVPEKKQSPETEPETEAKNFAAAQVAEVEPEKKEKIPSATEIKPLVFENSGSAFSAEDLSFDIKSNKTIILAAGIAVVPLIIIVAIVWSFQDSNYVYNSNNSTTRSFNSSTNNSNNFRSNSNLPVNAINIPNINVNSPVNVNTGPSAKITSVVTKHNASEYGENGMAITVTFTTNGCKGKDILGVARIYYENGKPVLIPNPRTSVRNQPLAVGASLVPSNSPSKETFVIFMGYLDLPERVVKLKYKVGISVMGSKKELDTWDFVDFDNPNSNK